jgi:micrococcal nuclease
MYEYRAYVRRVYDGDTITVDIDLGFGMTACNQKVRLLKINAPEIRGKERPKGLKSRDALRSKIANKWIIIKTKKDKKGKYGRWLAEVWIDDLCINDWLISEGLATEYK